MNFNHHPTDIESRLDAAIDALNAGQSVSENGDPELASLIATVQSARNSAEPEWPDAGFPGRLARNLSAQLRETPQQVARTDNGHMALPPTPAENWGPFSGRATEPATLTDDDRQPSRRRQVAGIIAAAAAFSLLTFLLVTVFDAWRSPSAVYYENRGSINESRQIAFVKDVESDDLDGHQAEIFLIDTNGDNLTNLTNHPADDHQPAWSPDGETLAFVSNRTGRDQIYLMDADGGNVRQITSGNGPAEYPIWSPDGTRIAFIQQGDGIADPWIMAADGSGQQPLVNASEGEPISGPLIWSPNGEMVAYTYQLQGLGVGISSADGEESRLISIVGVAIGSIDWSADGAWLSITPFTVINNVGLIDARNILQGSSVSPQPFVTDPQMNITQPHWEPSGSRLLFFGSVGLPTESDEIGLYVADISGSSMEKIHALDTTPWLIRVDWSPTGRQIAFTRLGESHNNSPTTGDTFELVVINADGSGERVLADDVWSVWTDPLAWRPHPSDTTTSSPTEVPRPEQTAEPIWDATPVQPTPEGSPEPDEATIPALTPTQPATDDFAAQVQAALDALPDEMVGCNATPGTPKQLNPGAQTGTEYRGLALVGKEPLLAMAWGEEDDTIQEGIGPTRRAIIGWYIGSESTSDFELEVRELGDGTTLEPEYGGILEPNDWMEGPVHFTTMQFPTSGCWQVVATNGDRAGVVWIDVPEEPLETAAPTLTLNPAIGTCETTPTLRGAGFEPGTQVTVFVGQARGDNPATLGDHPTVAVDGTFEAQIDPRPAITSACQSGQIPAGGLDYTVSVMTGTGPKPDGDDWRAPMGSTTYTLVADEASTSPEALDAAILESAIDTVRTFLDEPDAELAGEVVTTADGERQAFISRQVDGVPYDDEFVVDVRTGQLLSAIIPGRTTLGLPAEPVSQEDSEIVAEQIASRTRPGFDQLTQTETSDGCTMPGAQEPDPCVTFRWQLRANDLVWYPSGVSVTIDLETGQVVRYSSYHEVYRGPLEPLITEDEARAIATDNLNADPDLEDQEITTMRLAITQIVTELNADGLVTGEEWCLTWTAEISGPPQSGVRLNVVIDASTGEVLNPEWTANG